MKLFELFAESFIGISRFPATVENMPVRRPRLTLRHLSDLRRFRDKKEAERIVRSELMFRMYNPQEKRGNGDETAEKEQGLNAKTLSKSAMQSIKSSSRSKSKQGRKALRMVKNDQAHFRKKND